MIADWSVEAGAGSPTIVLPWPGWVDGRGASVAGVAEAQAYPELKPLLALANQHPTLSSKVDVFAVTLDDADPEIADFGEAAVQHGLGSYLDFVLPQPPLAFAQAEAGTRAMAGGLKALAWASPACSELVLRPADLWGSASWGWTLYTMGFGPTLRAARAEWAAAAQAALVAAREALLAQRW
jgi:hypothetical protein